MSGVRIATLNGIMHSSHSPSTSQGPGTKLKVITEMAAAHILQRQRVRSIELMLTVIVAHFLKSHTRMSKFE